MDIFKAEQLHPIGPGGIKCSCCNHKARKHKGTVDKKLNREARARIKAVTRELAFKYTRHGYSTIYDY